MPADGRSRAERRVGEMSTAADGKEAAAQAWSWWLSALKDLADQDPVAADIQAWKMSVNVGGSAARMHQAAGTRSGHRGLLPGDVQFLLDPQAVREGGNR
jgi:hypothetical protein